MTKRSAGTKIEVGGERLRGECKKAYLAKKVEEGFQPDNKKRTEQ